jgi:ribonuclease P protein component
MALGDMAKQNLGRHERIRKRKQYLAIYQQGKRSYSKNFTAVICRNQSGTKRLGIAASKKMVGCAAKRNRVKRLIREFFRLNKLKLSDSHDFVVIVKKDISWLAYQNVCRELEGLLFKKADAE